MTFGSSKITTYERYVAFIKSTGFQAPNSNKLKEFIDILSINFAQSIELTQDMIDYGLTKVKISEKSYRGLISLVRGYTRYLNIKGFKAFIPDDTYSRKKDRYIPHKFTYDELNILFDKIDSIEISSRSPNREYYLPVIFRMMYCCGMRPQEVFKIKKEDINIETGEIYIRKTKAYKDRHIYLSEDLLKMIKIYYKEIAQHNNIFLFEDKNHNQLLLKNIRKVFKKIIIKNNLDPKIRPYDLRHAFITNTLTEWLENKEDITTLIPYLTEYVGHDNFENTFYYLHLIPENITKNSGINWKNFSELYPKVGDENEI